MFIESNQIRCIICACEYEKSDLRCPKCGFPVYLLSSDVSKDTIWLYRKEAGVVNKLDDPPQIKYAPKYPPFFTSDVNAPVKNPFVESEFEFPDFLKKGVCSNYSSKDVFENPRHIFCSNCGNKMTYGARFCSACGSRLQYVYRQAKDDTIPGNSFDWSSIIDEPHERNIHEVKSPWIKDNDYNNKMSFIDVLKAEKEEKEKRAKERTFVYTNVFEGDADMTEEIETLKRRLEELMGTDTKQPDGEANHTSNPERSFDVSEYYNDLAVSEVKPEDLYLDILPTAKSETESEKTSVDEPILAIKEKNSDSLSLEEIEMEFFGEPNTTEVEYEETKKIDKFYNLYRKNEEFQKLLDEEYNKLKSDIFAQTINPIEEIIDVEPSDEETIYKEAAHRDLNVINYVDSVTVDEICSKLEGPIYYELKRITGKKAPTIQVIGVGGGGCNVINRMVDTGLQGVTLIGVNTDRQALSKCKAEIKIVLGEKIAGGRTAGSNPEIGQRAAEESVDEIIPYIQDADMVFIIAGMGNGTGTGATPVIAKASMDCGVLTVAVVTKPFTFEGKKRWNRATKGIQYLSNFVDSLVVIPNDRLIDTSEKNTSMLEAFAMLDNILTESIQSILFQP